MARKSKEGMMHLVARVTLVTGSAGETVTVPPGGTLELPQAEAERLIAAGFAVLAAADGAAGGSHQTEPAP